MGPILSGEIVLSHRARMCVASEDIGVERLLCMKMLIMSWQDVSIVRLICSAGTEWLLSLKILVDHQLVLAEEVRTSFIPDGYLVLSPFLSDVVSLCSPVVLIL